MSNFRLGELEIAVNDYGYATHISWSGVGDQPAPAVTMRPFLNELRGRLKERHVSMDFKNLQYANSATVTEIVFIVRGAAADAKHVEISYDSRVQFQKSVFTTLERLQVHGDRLKFIHN